MLHSPTMVFRFIAASLPRGRALASLYCRWNDDSLGYISTRTVVVLAYTVTVTCSARRTSSTRMPSLSRLTSMMGSPSRWVDAAGYNCRTTASTGASEPERGRLRQASTGVAAVDEAIDYQA